MQWISLHLKNMLIIHAWYFYILHTSFKHPLTPPPEFPCAITPCRNTPDVVLVGTRPRTCCEAPTKLQDPNFRMQLFSQKEGKPKEVASDNLGTVIQNKRSYTIKTHHRNNFNKAPPFFFVWMNFWICLAKMWPQIPPSETHQKIFCDSWFQLH